MPKKSKKAHQLPLESKAKYPDPSLSLPEKLEPGSSNPSADWLEKNAHAKAIIMSTLIPGSEPWKIAEPLEYAADIWKALEDRYAPKNDPEGNRLERADFVNDWVEGRDMDKYRDGPKRGAMLTEFPADALNPEMTSKFTKQLEDVIRDKTVQSSLVEEITRIEEEKKALKEQRKKKANAAAAKVMAEHMPNRDQRFLWALLHGGKEETMNWFNGTTAAANAT